EPPLFFCPFFFSFNQAVYSITYVAIITIRKVQTRRFPSMKYKISLSISALCFFMALLIFLAGRAQSQEALADRISPNILRFHVLAESSRSDDQVLKLGVKNLVLDYVHRYADP